MQRISRDVSGHLKKNTEEEGGVHLSYPHILLQPPRFVFVNSEVVCFSDGSHTGS